MQAFCLNYLQAIDLELPLIVKLIVVDTDPGVKGDTAQGEWSYLFLSLDHTKSSKNSPTLMNLIQNLCFTISKGN